MKILLATPVYQDSFADDLSHPRGHGPAGSFCRFERSMTAHYSFSKGYFGPCPTVCWGTARPPKRPQF